MEKGLLESGGGKCSKSAKVQKRWIREKLEWNNCNCKGPTTAIQSNCEVQMYKNKGEDPGGRDGRWKDEVW